MPRFPRPSARGSSLIELMIAMAVMAVGLLAMWHLHVVGITSTAAGRRHTVATAIARELVSGLERLPFTDTRLYPHCKGPGTADALPPDCTGKFGALVDPSGDVRAGRAWSDSDPDPVPGVRLDSELRARAEGYTRQWTVWGVLSPSAPSTADPGAKLIAVSVTWRDPPFARPREVVLYAQVVNAGSLVAGLANSQ